MIHVFAVRVYYEDTDLAGIVYHANYLKFIERARTEWVRGLGVDQVRMKGKTGLVFAVRRVEADYLRPARFDDTLQIETRMTAISGARLYLTQEVLRGAERLSSAQVVLVCMTDKGHPARLPMEIRRILAPQVP